MPRQGAQTLSDVHGASLTLICAPCKREGRYSVARLKAKYGNPALLDLRAFLSADCPKRASLSVYGRCQARFAVGP
jgi:hypothetical protein